jgi:hypothetical protein
MTRYQASGISVVSHQFAVFILNVHTQYFSMSSISFIAYDKKNVFSPPTSSGLREKHGSGMNADEISFWYPQFESLYILCNAVTLSV